MIAITRLANQKFTQARNRAFFEGWRNYLTHRPNELLSFEPVRNLLHLHGAVDRGLQEIELENIVGSVGRDREFTRMFRPKRAFTKSRWRRVAELLHQRGFAPIIVYQVSQVYLVVDGNHRVSVSRAYGLHTIEAYVREFQTSVPVHKDDDLHSITQKMREMPFEKKQINQGEHHDSIQLRICQDYSGRTPKTGRAGSSGSQSLKAQYSC